MGHVLETPTYVPILLGMDLMENLHAQINLSPGRGSLRAGLNGQTGELRVLGNKHRALSLVGLVRTTAHSRRARVSDGVQIHLVEEPQVNPEELWFQEGELTPEGEESEVELFQP